MSAIHGTSLSIAKLQEILRRHPSCADTKFPMLSVLGIPFITHETDVQARTAAWEQAVKERGKVILVEDDKLIQIDGMVMAELLGKDSLRYTFGNYQKCEPIFKVQP